MEAQAFKTNSGILNRVWQEKLYRVGIIYVFKHSSKDRN